MNILSRRDVESGLQRKGFAKSDNDHAKFIYHTFFGKKTAIWTKTSRGTSHKDISSDNFRNMAKQVHLSVDDFYNMINCPLSRKDYEEKMVNQGHIRLL